MFAYIEGTFWKVTFEFILIIVIVQANNVYGPKTRRKQTLTNVKFPNQCLPFCWNFVIKLIQNEISLFLLYILNLPVTKNATRAHLVKINLLCQLILNQIKLTNSKWHISLLVIALTPSLHAHVSTCPRSDSDLSLRWRRHHKNKPRKSFPSAFFRSLVAWLRMSTFWQPWRALRARSLTHVIKL